MASRPCTAYSSVRQSSIRELETVLTKRVIDLDKREERLLDLAEQGLPQHKIRQRINQLREDRERVEAERNHAGKALATGAELLEECLALLADVGAIYRQANDAARSSLNDANFKRLLLDEDGIHDAEVRPPFDAVLGADQAHRRAMSRAAHANSATVGDHDVTVSRGAALTLSRLLPIPGGETSRGWNKRLMAEDRGLRRSSLPESLRSNGTGARSDERC